MGPDPASAVAARRVAEPSHTHCRPAVAWSERRRLEIEMDFEERYRAMETRDESYAGQFFVGVTSTGIYCRPGCPARTPKRENIRFYLTAAEARSDGFRACLRCRPDEAR